MYKSEEASVTAQNHCLDCWLLSWDTSGLISGSVSLEFLVPVIPQLGFPWVLLLSLILQVPWKVTMSVLCSFMTLLEELISPE